MAQFRRENMVPFRKENTALRKREKRASISLNRKQ